MCCNLWNATEERAAQTTSQSVLAGTLVSSLHRLKDVDNTGKLNINSTVEAAITDEVYIRRRFFCVRGFIGEARRRVSTKIHSFRDEKV